MVRFSLTNPIPYDIIKHNKREHMTQDYTMVWPTHRTVSEDIIRMKYSDAVANGEVDYTDLTDIDEIMDELESAGLVAFSRI